MAIARALVRRPRVILADEPTASLDRVTGREIVDLLQRLAREEDCALILITHDQRILSIADRPFALGGWPPLRRESGAGIRRLRRSAFSVQRSRTWDAPRRLSQVDESWRQFVARYPVIKDA